MEIKKKMKILQTIFKKRKLLSEYNKKEIVWVDDFRENKAWVKFVHEGVNLCGFINRKFEIIIDPVFSKVKHFSCGFAPYYNGACWGFIDTKGRQRIKPEFYDVGEGFVEGLAPVREVKAGCYGFIGKNGLYKLPPIYQVAWNFHGGRAQVVINNEFFFINKKGEIISKALHSYYGV